MRVPRRKAPIRAERLEESIVLSSRNYSTEDEHHSLRVQTLLAENEKLKDKNSELLEMNRKLVDEGKLLDRAEINSIYHILFVEEHKKEVTI